VTIITFWAFTVFFGLFTTGKTSKGRTIIFLEGGMKNLEKNCLQNQKSPNKLFAGMKRRKKKFADQLIHSLICISKFSPIC